MKLEYQYSYTKTTDRPNIKPKYELSSGSCKIDCIYLTKVSKSELIS